MGPVRRKWADGGDRTVSIVIPARDERRDIERCIEAVRQQDWPRDRLEVIIVDGASTDGTATVAAEALARTGLAAAQVVTNPAGSTPSNLNLGLTKASGTYLCRVDARSLIPPDYVRRCVETLASRPEVAVVGGTQRALALDGDASAVGIARALNHRWSMGLSRYRRGATSGPSDTVYLGAFRTDELRAEGGWDEALTTNQDFDLNRRMARRGVVWFDAGLTVGYVPRADLRELARQYFRFGRWKAFYWRHRRVVPQPRQIAALVGPPAAIGAGLTALCTSRLARLALPVAVVLGIATHEALGSTGLPGGPKARAISMAATACVVGSWIVGAWRGLLSGGREPA